MVPRGAASLRFYVVWWFLRASGVCCSAARLAVVFRCSPVNRFGWEVRFLPSAGLVSVPHGIAFSLFCSHFCILLC